MPDDWHQSNGQPPCQSGTSACYANGLLERRSDEAPRHPDLLLGGDSVIDFI